MPDGAELVEYDQEVEHRTGAAIGLFDTSDPQLVIEKATAVANALQDVLDRKHLISNIRGRKYIQVEGWTTLGALVGVFPRVEWTRPMQRDDGGIVGWEAAVEVVNRDGVVIGRAEGECLRTESNWRSREDYALRSMAQTRAMSKALRMPLGFIAVLAGYEATPAEEMPSGSPPEPEPEPITGNKAELLAEVQAQMERLKEKPEWSLAKICEAAKVHWGKEYTRLNQFTKEELTAVLRAAQSVEEV